MEQSEIVHKYYVAGTSTLNKILKVMAHLSTDGLTKIIDNKIPLTGETNLYKLLGRSDPVTSAFLNEKVDLNKLKTFLTEQGLPFAFNKAGKGTNLYFKVKDKELAKNALERVITSLSKNPKMILKKPGSMTFEEKLAYAKSDPVYKGTIKKSQTAIKGRGK